MCTKKLGLTFKNGMSNLIDSNKIFNFEMSFLQNMKHWLYDIQHNDIQHIDTQHNYLKKTPITHDLKHKSHPA